MNKILVLYHYYWPDDVVSSFQFTDLSEGLNRCGWEVEVWPSNRSCHDKRKTYSTQSEIMHGVKIRRVWRPNLSQHSFLGRIFNSVWIQTLWWWRLLVAPGYQPDIILLGTDPLLSLFCVPFLKRLRPQTKIVHWCFDLYPEAVVADHLLSENSKIIKVTRDWMKKGYETCSLVVDIGSCMKEKIQKYPIKKSATLTPWALKEPAKVVPPDLEERFKLFGEAPLTLLYSGSLGRAHEFHLTLQLARLMKGKAGFTYSVRGSRLNELKKAIKPEDTHIRLVDFAPADRFEARLTTPDIHIVSLRTQWSGVVVPSKFFGALAMGRPVLYEGEEKSTLALWIKDYQVGWVLTQHNMQQVFESLLELGENQVGKESLFKHCHGIYQAHFSKEKMINGWKKEIEALLKG